MGELVLGRPVMRQLCAVSPLLVLSSALALTFRVATRSGQSLENGFDPELLVLKDSMSDELIQDLQLLLGFSGPYLYYVEELLFVFDALSPDRLNSTYDEYFATLSALPPQTFKDMAVNAVQRVYRDRDVYEMPPDSDDLLRWKHFLRPGITAASIEEAAGVLVNPVSLKERTLRLLDGFWRNNYEALYISKQADLERSVRYARELMHPVVQIAFSELTGQMLPDEVAERLSRVTRVVYSPSVHLGSFVQFIFYEPDLILYFNPDYVLESQARRSRRRSPADELSVQDALAGIKAIADPTRLSIIDMLRKREHYAQEIVSRLGISQSAVSRHLGTLESSGVVSVRPSHGMKYYAVNSDFLRALSAYVDQLAGQREQ